MQNSREKELKAKRRSLLGVIDRRSSTILILEGERRDARSRLEQVEEELREYGWKPRK
jgi:hypothetical protein